MLKLIKGRNDLLPDDPDKSHYALACPKLMMALDPQIAASE